MESVFYRLVLPLFRYGNGHFSVRAVPLDDAVYESEERVVLAHAYVFTGIVHRSALTNDNVARLCELTAEQFDAESLAFRLAAVL